MAFITFKKNLVFSVLFLFVTLISYSQRVNSIEVFSKEFDVYTQELKVYLNVSSNSESKKVFKQFMKNKDEYTDLEQSLFIDISNYMLSKSYKAKPYFIDFLNTASFVYSKKIENPN